MRLLNKAQRKIRRRIESDAYAKDARFWRNTRSADRMGYDKPVNRQAAKELETQTRHSSVGQRAGRWLPERLSADLVCGCEVLHQCIVPLKTVKARTNSGE